MVLLPEWGMNDISTSVVLPCSTKDFGSFISSLLGKPQSILNTIAGPFELGRENVHDVHALLTQRVSQQNDAVLTQFTAQLMFSDSSSVLLNSINEFSSYTEIRQVFCHGLHLSWVFLVKFQDKEHPEKQQIDISFLAGPGAPLLDAGVPFSIMGAHLGAFGTGYITYQIAHTARTWGADIDSLLTQHLRGLVDDIPGYRKWLARHTERISTFTFCLLFLASIVGTFAASSAFVAGQKARIAGLGEASAIGAANQKQMAYLIDTVASGTWERFLLISSIFLMLSVVVAVLVAAWVSSTANNLPPSFLLLTKESERNKQRVMKRRQAKWLSFVGAVVFSLITGVGGNVCYALWFQHLID